MKSKINLICFRKRFFLIPFLLFLIVFLFCLFPSSTLASDENVSIIIPDEIDVSGKTDFKIEIYVNNSVTQKDINSVWIEQNKDGVSYIYMGKDIELLTKEDGKTNTLVINFFSSDGFEEGVYDVFINEKNTALNWAPFFCKKTLAKEKSQLEIKNNEECRALTENSKKNLNNNIPVIVFPNEDVTKEDYESIINSIIAHNQINHMELINDNNYSYFYTPFDKPTACKKYSTGLTIEIIKEAAIFHSDALGYTQIGENEIYLIAPNIISSGESPTTIIAHEMGHAEGFLQDEYVMEGTMRSFVMIDENYNCYKTAIEDVTDPQSVLKATQRAAKYYQNRIGNPSISQYQIQSGCNYYGGMDYNGNFWFRSTKNSIMNLGDITFGKVNKFLFNEAFKKKRGRDIR